MSVSSQDLCSITLKTLPNHHNHQLIKVFYQFLSILIGQRWVIWPNRGQKREKRSLSSYSCEQLGWESIVLRLTVYYVILVTWNLLAKITQNKNPKRSILLFNFRGTHTQVKWNTVQNTGRLEKSDSNGNFNVTLIPTANAYRKADTETL